MGDPVYFDDGGLSVFGNLETEIYRYHQDGSEWVIRRYHANGFEGVGSANGEIEAKSICAGMNASIMLVLWDNPGVDNIELLSMAVESAKRAVEPMKNA
jgi:hypothetical protein